MNFLNLIFSEQISRCHNCKCEIYHGELCYTCDNILNGHNINENENCDWVDVNNDSDSEIISIDCDNCDNCDDCGNFDNCSANTDDNKSQNNPNICFLHDALYCPFCTIFD